MNRTCGGVLSGYARRAGRFGKPRVLPECACEPFKSTKGISVIHLLPVKPSRPEITLLKEGDSPWCPKCGSSQKHRFFFIPTGVCINPGCGMSDPQRDEPPKAPSPEYYRQHCCCPKCGSMKTEETTMPSMAGIDRNHCTCRDCRWQGSVHDLVSAENQKTPLSK